VDMVATKEVSVATKEAMVATKEAMVATRETTVAAMATMEATEREKPSLGVHLVTLAMEAETKVAMRASPLPSALVDMAATKEAMVATKEVLVAAKEAMVATKETTMAAMEDMARETLSRGDHLETLAMASP